MEQKHHALQIKFAAFFCGVFAICLYLNTLSAQFAYDDNRAILRNPDLLQETPLINIFYNDFWGTPLTHSGSHKSYRPLCVLTFRFNHAFHGLEPFGYHLFNVVCHGLVTFLYVIVVSKITDEVVVAAISGVLFACHPIHTEAVAGVVGRADLLSSVFFLCAFLCYTEYCTKSRCELKDKAQCSHLKCSVRSAMSMVGVGLFSAASMLCKEHGLLVLGVCGIYDLFIQKQLRLRSVLDFREVLKLEIIKDLLILFLIGSTLLGFRLLVMRGEPPEFAPADNPASESDSLLTRSLTFLYLPCVNFNLMLCPNLLSFDWSMDAIPLVQSCSDPRNFISFIFYGTLCLFTICTLKFLNTSERTSENLSERKRLVSAPEEFHKVSVLSVNFRHKRYENGVLRCVLMALAFIVIPFLPATNLFFYVGFVVAERILYIPSMGFCLVVAQGFWILISRLQNSSFHQNYRRFFVLLFLLLIVLFSCRTIRRNVDWQTEEDLYRSGLRINPAKALGNLGNVLKAQGKMEEAELAYKSALTHRSNMADVHYNLGLYYQEKKRYNEAIQSYVKALECRPKLTVAYLNLGLVYNAVGLRSKAEKLFRQCYEVDISGLKDPRLHEQAKTSALYNLGRLMVDDGRAADAVAVYKTSLKTAPGDYPIHSIYNMLGEAYFQLGDFIQAEENYRIALSLKPDHVPAFLTLAKLFQRKKQLKESELWLQKALEIDPTDVAIYRHYGPFLIECGRMEEAVDWLLRAFASDPEDFETVFNCANALRQAGRFAEAEDFYRRAVELNPGEVTARINLGAILHYNGKLDDAEDAYRVAEKMKPNDAIIQTNLRKLNNLKTQRAQNN